MKKLIKNLGLSSLLLLGGIALKAQDEPLYFSKAENQKYYISHSFADTNGDSIPELVLAKYDININGIVDTYALFLVTGRDSTNYQSSDRAFVVGVDNDEDGIEDFYFLDTNLDGILEKSGEFKKERKIVV